MRTISVNLYQYGELSERAKAKARDWWQNASSGDTWWSEHITEDFADVLKAAGFDITNARGRRTELAIYWELNPDAAGFAGTWSASRVNVAAIIADRPVTYKSEDGATHTCEHNARLVPILERVAALAQRAPDSYGSVSVQRGPHIAETEWQREDCRDLECTCDADGDEFGEIARDLAAFLARSLSKEWDYCNSEEYIAETIEANEYEFTEDGERA